MIFLQWGNYLNMLIDANPRPIGFPISFNHYLHCLATIQRGDIPSIVICPYISTANNTSMTVVIDYETGQGYSPGTDVTNVLWLAIGR